MRGSGGYFLYWMPKAQRLELNHAPEYAAQKANELGRRPFSSPTDAGAYEKQPSLPTSNGKPSRPCCHPGDREAVPGLTTARPSTASCTCSAPVPGGETCPESTVLLSRVGGGFNAWCELRSPSQQFSEGQPGATESIVEPDAEVVQGHPRRQTRPQPTQLVRPLLPQAEGVEKFVVDRLHDLADAGHPTPQALGPSLAGVARLGGQISRAP